MSFQEGQPLVDPDDSPSTPDKPAPKVDPDSPLEAPEDTEHVDQDRPLDPPGGPEVEEDGYASAHPALDE